MVRQAIEHLVGAELAAVLGPPDARDGARVGYRHGSKVRTITSPVGVVTLTVPRARLQAGASAATKWQSQVLPAYARRMRQVNEAINHHELVLRPRPPGSCSISERCRRQLRTRGTQEQGGVHRNVQSPLL